MIKDNCVATFVLTHLKNSPLDLKCQPNVTNLLCIMATMQNGGKFIRPLFKKHCGRLADVNKAPQKLGGC